jgi:hypothetical protein
MTNKTLIEFIEKRGSYGQFWKQIDYAVLKIQRLWWRHAVIWNIRTRRNFPQRHAWWAFHKQARRDLKKLSATNFDVIGIEFDLADDFATRMR